RPDGRPPRRLGSGPRTAAAALAPTPDTARRPPGWTASSVTLMTMPPAVAALVTVVLTSLGPGGVR
ncbi:hypothetical protein, partial [Frankia nepalensis]|uniref:hypothetical protein n=1 Tax=Frankia nepalensis TaxID=1836974 RepID=UPI001EE4537C